MRRFLVVFVAFIMLLAAGCEGQASSSQGTYSVSADLGEAESEYLAGYRCYHGEGTGQDFGLAAEHFAAAAEAGQSDAACYLGYMYEYGQGVRQDYETAFLYYEFAADQGNVYAQYVLGFLYENGYGVNRDYDLAWEWYSLAAAGGSREAEEAMPGIRQNVSAAKLAEPAPEPKVNRKYYPNGNLKENNFYDLNGNLMRRNRFNRYGKLDSYTEYEKYDGNGNALEYTIYYPRSYGKYASYHYQRRYDSDGNETGYSYTYADGTKGSSGEYQNDHDGKTIGATYYDENGNVSSIRTDYRYDPEGKLTAYTCLKPDRTFDYECRYRYQKKETIEIIHVDAQGNTVYCIRYDPEYGDEIYYYSLTDSGNVYESKYTYYSDGYRIEHTGDYQQVEYYDTDGNEVRSEWPDGRYEIYEYYPDGSYKSTDYDADGKISWIWYWNSDGKIVRDDYYRDGVLHSYSVNEYDGQGRESRSYDYDANGNLEYYYVYEYDSLGRDTVHTAYKADGSFFWATEYRYDADGKKYERTKYSSNNSWSDWKESEY